MAIVFEIGYSDIKEIRSLLKIDFEAAKIFVEANRRLINQFDDPAEAEKFFKAQAILARAARHAIKKPLPRRDCSICPNSYCLK